MSLIARLLALVIFGLAAASLVAQFMVSSADYPGPLETAWGMARYFTILTTVMAALTFGKAAVTGVKPGGFWLSGLVLWEAITGVVYHALLYKPQVGLAFWADHGLHSATPLAVALWWLIWNPRRPMQRLFAPLLWLWWPFFYFLYATGRGHIDGKYPYFFIDMDKLSFMQVGTNFVQLLAAFLVAGFVIFGITRTLHRPKRKQGQPQPA